MSFETNKDYFGQQKPQQQHPKVHEDLKPVQAPTSSGSSIPEINLSIDKLPSHGIAYPNNAWIKYRSYSFGEIKKSSQDKMNEKDSFEFVLSGVSSNFDKYTITVADALYIGLLRKISTLGTNRFIVPYKCTKCSSDERQTLDMMALEFDDIKAPELPVCVEFVGKDYHFTPITIRGYFDLCEEKKQADEVAIMAKQSNVPFTEAYEFMYNASVEDGRVLTEIDEQLYHGLKPLDAKCSKCGNHHRIELDGGQALLIPFREREEPAKTRIRFGTKAPHKSSASRSNGLPRS